MRTSLATNKNSQKNNTVCSRCWNPPGNQSSQKEQRRAAGKSTGSSTLGSSKCYGKSTRHLTGSATPAPTNSTSVRFLTKARCSDAPEISIHSSERHFDRICGFDIFLMKLLVCRPPARVCDSTISTSSTSTDPPTDWRASRPLTTRKIWSAVNLAAALHVLHLLYKWRYLWNSCTTQFIAASACHCIDPLLHLYIVCLWLCSCILVTDHQLNWLIISHLTLYTRILHHILLPGAACNSLKTSKQIPTAVQT